MKIPAVIMFADLCVVPDQNNRCILNSQYILHYIIQWNWYDLGYTAYAKWEARAELFTAYFVTVLNRNIQLMTENLAVDDKPYVVFVYRHITTMRTPGYKLRSQKETLFYKRFHDAAANR